MHAKSWFLTLSAVVALLALGFAVKDRVARIDIERDLAASALQRSQLDADIRQAEQRLAVAESEQDRVHTTLDTTRRKAATAKAEPARKTGPAPAPMTALRNALLNDPQMQNLQLAAVQTKLLGTYRPLCQQLNLSPAQTEQFLALLRKRGEQEMDLSAIRETQQQPADDPVFAKMKQQMADELRAAQTALLGDAGFRQFETYERTVPAREFVNELAGATAVAGASITSDQADALTQAMTNASPTYQQGGTANVLNINWDQVLANAGSTLSEAQFALLKNAVVQFRNMDRMRQLVRNASATKPGGG